MQMYKVTRNGETIVVTWSYKNAAEAYDACIYRGKEGDIIRLLTRKNKKDEWELARKDWL